MSAREGSFALMKHDEKETEDDEKSVGRFFGLWEQMEQRPRLG